MIMDSTGIVLTPGNGGADCLGNGLHKGIECCCDECDYMLCCLETPKNKDCNTCSEKGCPRSGSRTI